MKYELAKQLKEAGFPQEGSREGYCLDCQKWKDAKCFDNKHKTEWVKIPTLSELIEACKYKNWSGLLLLSIQNEGCAVGYKGIGEQGQTPEEAVANLWLALQKQLTQPPKA